MHLVKSERNWCFGQPRQLEQGKALLWELWRLWGERRACGQLQREAAIIARSLLIYLRQCATTAKSNPSFFSLHWPRDFWFHDKNAGMFPAMVGRDTHHGQVNDPVEDPSSLPLPMASHRPSHSKADELHLKTAEDKGFESESTTSNPSEDWSKEAAALEDLPD